MIGNLTRIGQIFFPFVNLLYISGCVLWDIPLNELTLILLGVSILMLNISAFLTDYQAGTIEVEHLPDGTKRYSLNLNSDPEDLDKRKKVVFYVEESRD